MEKRWITSQPLIGYFLIGICGLLTGCGSSKANKGGQASPNQAKALWETPSEWKMPSYQRRTLYEWADIGVMASNQPPWSGTDMVTVSNAIHQMRLEAIPWILSSVIALDSMDRHDQLDSQKASEQARIFKVPDPTLFQTTNLILQIGRPFVLIFGLSHEATVLVPHLLQLRPGVAQMLVPLIGPAGLPELKSQLISGSGAPLSNAVSAASAIGHPAISLGPDLWASYKKTGNPAILRALSNVGYGPNEVITELSSKDLLYELGQLGPVGWKAISPRLVSTNALTRRSAMQAIARSATGEHFWPTASTNGFIDLSPFRLSFTQEFIRCYEDRKLEFVASLPKELKLAYLKETGDYLARETGWIHDHAFPFQVLTRACTDSDPLVRETAIPLLKAAESAQALRKPDPIDLMDEEWENRRRGK